MPARTTRPEGRVPARLVRLRALPEGEIADVVLAVLIGLDTLADSHSFRVEPGQSSICRPGRDPEEDRAILGPVSVTSLEQRLDEGDHLRYMLGRARHHVRRGHAESRHVRQELLSVAFRDLFDRN